MNIADIGRAFSIGTLCVLAVGVLIWAVLHLRKNGFSIPPVLAIVAACVLLLIASGLHLAGFSFDS